MRLSSGRTRLSAVLLVAFVLLSSDADGQSIRTVAGGGNDDGLPATQGALNFPTDVAVGNDGTIYIADFYNYKIRKVTPSGTLLTAIGDGSEAIGGDNIPARSVSMGPPSGVAVDSAGNIYYVDGNRVRKMSASSGLVATIAGSGTEGYSGDGGPATAAQLRAAWRVAVDSAGNLFISDRGNHVIRRVDAATQRISTVVGNNTPGSSGDGGAATQAQLNGPKGITVDGAGNLYIADTENHRVRRVDASTRRITTIAGTGSADSSGDGGPATAASLNAPDGLSLRADGSLLVCEGSGQRVRIIDPSGVIRSVAGNGSADFDGDGGPALEASLGNPSGIAVAPNGALLIADTDNYRIRRVDPASGTIATVAGSDLREIVGDGGTGINATLKSPYFLATDIAGNVYIAETFGHRVRKLQRGGGIITTVAGRGEGGGSSGDGGPATEAGLSPSGLALDSAGNLYVGEVREPKSIRKVVASTGIITTIAGGNGAGYAGDGGDARQAKLNDPGGMLIDANGFLYVADSLNHRIRRIELASNRIETYAGTGVQGYSGDGGPATQAQLDQPNGVALDSAGNLYIADMDNQRIRRVDATTRTISTYAGSGPGGRPSAGYGGDGGPASSAKLGRPRNLGFDALGNLFIGDAQNQRIRRVDASSGVITTIAGTGINAFAGDGGPATNATLADPRAIVFDDAGNLYFTDSDNNRVRAISGCVSVGGPSLVFPPNNAPNVVLSPTLRWNAVDGAFRYDVYLDEAGASTLLTQDVAATSYSAGNLLPGRRYVWRVEAKGDPFCTPLSKFSSATLAFTTASGCVVPGEFALSAPANGATSIDANPTLTWQSSSGASIYDVYLGITNPPPLLGSTSSTSFSASSLAPGTRYSWYVAAHAACDATKSRPTTVSTFTTAGNCEPAGAFSTLSPSNGATVPSGSLSLSWQRSTGAAAYDLFLGTATDPPLYRANLPSTGLTIDGLLPSTSYSWKVVARSGCGTTTSTTPIVRFTTAAECLAPATPSILFAPPGNVQSGKSYVIVWQDTAAGSGTYLAERSTDPAFASILDSQSTPGNSASFVASAPGTYHHRIRAVAGCNPSVTSAPSASASVSAVAAAPNVVFTVQPRSVVAQLNERLETLAATFSVENIGASSVQVLLGRQEIASVPFFSIVDPLSDGSPFVSLEPRKPRSFEIRFSGPKPDTEATYQGIIFLASTTTPLPITPYAFVNLKVGGATSARPLFLVGGQPSDYAFFPGFSGDEAVRPPITVSIRNPGTTPLELGAEIGPELWLVPEAGWNATPLLAGGSRDVRLTTQRSRAPSGSALPRYTYFTVRARSGETARLLVQDNDASRVAAARASDSAASYIVPDILSVTDASVTLLTRVRLTNVGSEAVEASLFFTPEGVDGFAATVKTAVVVVPPNDAVTLTDPLVQLFGLPRPARGQLEIRATTRSLGFLAVSASNATLAEPETALEDTPVLRRFEGLGLGGRATLGGIASDGTVRSELVLAESSGTDGATVRVGLAGGDGVELAAKTYSLARYGAKRIDDLASELGGVLSGTGSLRISVTGGGGNVATFARRVDRATRTGATIVPVELPADEGAGRQSAATTPAIVSYTIPSAASGTSASLATAVGLTAPPSRAVTVTVIFLPELGGRFESIVPISAGRTIEYKDILRDLFKLAGSQKGVIQILAPADVHLYSLSLAAPVSPGLPPPVGSNPVIPGGSTSFTGPLPGLQRPLFLDGLDQSIDPSRGNRWNVFLTETRGGTITVVVSLYEAGNRSTPIATREITVGANRQTRLESVFSNLGLDGEDRRKDRTNVLCIVTPKSGTGAISAVGEVIDNEKGSVRTLAFAPVSGTGSGSLAAPVAKGERKRPVRRP